MARPLKEYDSRKPVEILQDKKRFAELKRDVRRAEKRIGDKAKWLLDFAYRDLSQVNPDQLNDLCHQVLAFAVSEYKWPIPKEFRKGTLYKSPIPQLFLRFSHDGLWSRNIGLMAYFQDQLKRRFDDCKQGRVWEYRRIAPADTFTIFKVPLLGGAMSADLSVTLPAAHDILLESATDVLKRERERFGICQNAGCGTAFVAERKRRARYCQSKCAAYVRVMKSRGKL